MSSLTLAFFVALLTSQALSWEALPNIPSGRRSQFFVLREDGGYKYGYDTGDGNHAAKQEGDTANEVQGHYFYKNSAGQQLDLKYTSGVQGFQPEGLDKIQDFIKSSAPASSPYHNQAQAYSSPEGNDDNSGDYQPDDSGAYKPDNTGDYNPDDSGEYKPDNEGEYRGSQEPAGDATYNFNIDTASYKRTESSDAGGNIQGSYSYNNKEGTHDLQYVAGAEKGFIATSGSLSKPNGWKGSGSPARSAYQGYQGHHEQSAGPKGALNPDGSYSFGFSTNDQSRQESGDVGGNVHGSYSFRNSAGSHDLSYKAGSETGFLVTGGSLAEPNGLPKGASPNHPYSHEPYHAQSSPSAPAFKSSASDDGSYSFGFSTGDQDRQESSDASGNVRGQFSYRNSAGSHDLSYVAGSATGFLPTGGSLASPNGLGGAPLAKSSAGYSYPSPSTHEEYSQDAQADTGDASYNFNFDTPEYTRHETSDPHGNVKGSFSYRNKAGAHDLSFVAGSATGFQPTGGSLSHPNGLEGKSASHDTHSSHDSIYVEIPEDRSGDYSSSSDDNTSGDASYNFAFDTNEYSRQESSDASGNVQGKFSYKNSVGSHDLGFVAGSATGFKPTGGSLSTAPGLSESQLRAGFRGSSSSSSIGSFVSGKSSYEAPAATPHSSSPGETKSSYTLGNVKVHTYLPPSNTKHKFGYIFDS